ncbi:hypothetical protein FOCC_FOCC017415, partial [Frankliniella occidentalis]
MRCPQDEAHAPRPGVRRGRRLGASTARRSSSGRAHRHRQPAERGQPGRHLLLHDTRSRPSSHTLRRGFCSKGAAHNGSQQRI